MWATRPMSNSFWWWEQDSNLRIPSGNRFYRPAPLTTRPSHHEFRSRRQESNPQPAVYKTAALPLSYVGQIPARATLTNNDGHTPARRRSIRPLIVPDDPGAINRNPGKPSYPALESR